MKQARTIGEAAYEAFPTCERDVWQEDGGAFPADQVYVSRELAAGSAARHLAESKPYLRIKRRLFRSAGAQRFLLHGQIGTGKSMELKQLALDAQVRTSHVVISLSLAERLNLAVEVNIRLVLLALASEVAQQLVDDAGQRARHVGAASRGPLDAVLGEWLRILASDDPLLAPDKIASGPVEVQLNALLLKKTIQVRSDEAVRRSLGDDDHFSPSQMKKLVQELLRHLEVADGRKVLLVVDDGDKIGDDASARDVFVRNIRSLLDLPASVVLTVPFWLHFDPEFKAATRGAHREALANVKVVEREDRSTLAAPGRDFFWKLYQRLAAPELIEEQAFELAARCSGGVPREFIRLLAAGFDLADERNLDRLDLPTLQAAAALVRREYLGFTQDQRVRSALARIHRTRELAEPDDWKLLNAMLIVEYTNDEPWYDAHPLLLADAARWAEREGG